MVSFGVYAIIAGTILLMGACLSGCHIIGWWEERGTYGSKERARETLKVLILVPVVSVLWPLALLGWLVWLMVQLVKDAR